MANLKMFTEEQREKLLANGATPDDHPPVVKLFTPDANCTWLLSELDPNNPTMAFGLCDLGFGSPELGYVSITELESVRGLLGLPIERDLHCDLTEPLSNYATWSQEAGHIVLRKPT